MKKANKQILIKVDSTNKGYQILSHNIAKNQKLSANAKELYIYLNAQSENYYISYYNLAKMLNKSERTIAYTISELKKSGFLEIEGNGQTFTYKLYNEPKNTEYALNQILDANALDFTDFKAIADLCNEEHITEETRQKILKKLQYILDATPYDN